MEEQAKRRILSPADILESIGVTASKKHIDQLCKFAHLFCFLKKGDTFETSLAKFKKVDEHMIYITMKITSDQIVSDLKSNNTIYFAG